MLGVQSPDCDPVYKTMEGDLAAVLQVVPALVADAKLQWAAAPRYPKADLPKPVAPATTTTLSGKQAVLLKRPRLNQSSFKRQLLSASFWAGLQRLNKWPKRR